MWHVSYTRSALIFPTRYFLPCNFLFVGTAWYNMRTAKIFGYSHTMNQLIIGCVLIIAFLLRMVPLTTPWSFALFVRNILYRRNGQILPKSAALFYKYTHINSSVDTRTRPVALYFIYLCIYLFIPHGTVFLATWCALRDSHNGFELLGSWISTSI